MASRQTRNQLVPVYSVSPEEGRLEGGSFADLYHHLLTSSWPMLLVQIAAGFFALNAIFAVGYYLDGGIANARPGSFGDVFFFSVETMATIGYGRMAPVSLFAHMLMSFEALTGMIGLAVTTGLIFAKFSRPTARVRFSRYGVISSRDGVLSLMFRMANERSDQIVEAQVRVLLARGEVTVEGERILRFHDLELTRYRNATFRHSWTVIHPIRPGSPLYGCSEESLKSSSAEIVASVTGIDGAFMQTVYARHTYDAGDIVWGARLMDIMVRTPEDDVLIDYGKFDAIEPAAAGPQAEPIKV
ncbi:MAG: ATP-sensitive inward rectifier potassium channel 10 [Deltaproteobacteria bacterium]|nr:ATP-sensitive inward rectifier potassium channel 10 [Deltaproteobacteria bacterium]